jgi:hypothetical protein
VIPQHLPCQNPQEASRNHEGNIAGSPTASVTAIARPSHLEEYWKFPEVFGYRLILRAMPECARTSAILLRRPSLSQGMSFSPQTDNAIFEPRMLLPKSLAILLVAFLPRCKQRVNRITRWCQSLLAKVARVCPLRWLVTTAMSYNFMDASCCQWYGLRQAITIKASRWQGYSLLLPSLLIRALKLSLS